MDEALAMYEKGMTTGVNPANREMIEASTHFAPTISEHMQEFIVDPQTSGGLLVSVAEPESINLLDALHEGGVEHAGVIGSVRSLDGTEYLSFV